MFSKQLMTNYWKCIRQKDTPFIDVSFLRGILNSLHVPGGRIPKGGIDSYYLNIALTFAWTSL